MIRMLEPIIYIRYVALDLELSRKIKGW